MQDDNRAMEGKRVAFLTLGCKVNSYETEGMRELFLKAGAVETDFDKEADVYVVNTCSVTNIADRKSRQMLHRAKKNNPNAVVVAAGCYAQAAGDRLLEPDGVDLIIGNNQKTKIVELTEKILESREPEGHCALVEIAKEQSFEELPIETVTERTRAYVKIEDGCNQFCSYCIIPYVRGRVRSRDEKEILAEISRLAFEGYREVVLTGIHLSSYGLENKRADSDAEAEAPLLNLLRQIQNVDGIQRIRLGSLEPRIMTEAFVRELSSLSKICPHFHLSLQSGCDATLKRMNRKYTTAEYREVVACLRRYFDNPAITTDIIVGFPGETEEEFSETLRYATEIAFSQIHIFKFSRRAGTAADRMDNQIPESVKTERSGKLAQAECALQTAYRNSFAGKTEQVLFEEEVTVDGRNYITGHTTRYIKVYLPMEEKQIHSNETAEVFLSEKQICDGVECRLVC